MTRQIKIIIIAISICVLICPLLYIFGSFIYLSTSHRLAFRPHKRFMELSYDLSSFKYSREEVRKDLDELFDARLYTYDERDTMANDNAYGITKQISRIVVMDDGIPIYLYAFSLAHELVHLTHFTKSERYCNLVAFKTLYNTKKYKDVAIRYAVQDRDGFITQEYSCWEYIYDYLVKVSRYPILD